ncbi:uncharacterized protein KIAA1551 homolog [Python bivittatus]|uniref:Uncharacterized protein KIAA1551 homolog n=1 Tax=Python bivittatus TaxID=176946 RepID=A0A9F2REP3_PYTBI|nr:uncharacterized protein KIAA1551 homolog [Python bivittatus]
MDWNVGMTNKLQTRRPYLTPQVTSAASVTSQANVLMQNFCNSSGNSQTTNIPSSMKYILANKSQFRNNSASKTLRSIFPKTTVSDSSFGLSNNFYNLSPSSFSARTVQMAADVQNPNLSRNMHISSSIALQGNTVNSVQNMHQKTNAYMAMDSFNNQPLQNCSNSMRTSVYQQAPLNGSSPKGPPTLMPYYYLNGPATSQADARVSLNSVSDYYLPPQQNVQCPDYSSAKNCPNPGIPVAMQSHYASEQINPSPYAIYSHYDSRNAAQTTNINSSLLDLMAPLQANHGQFVLQQPTANLSNENVESYHRSLIDQSSNSYPVQPGQKSQSLSSSTETNAVGTIAYNVNGLKSTMQLSDESVKSFVEVEGNLSNNVPTATIGQFAEPLPQTNRTLQQENNVSNESLSKDKLKITRESLSLNVRTLYEMRNALLKLKDNFRLKQKIYQSPVQSGKTSNTLVNNQNHNLFPPPNTNQSVVCNVQQVPSDKVTANQFSSNSHNSSFVPQKTKNHLLPILWNMLKGTGDENMLLNADVEGGDKYQNKHFTIQENSCSDSNGDASGNPVNTDRTIRLSYKTSPIDSTQGTNIKNYKGFEQIANSAHNQLEKISAAAKDDIFNPIKQNKGSGDGVGQYLNDNIQSLVQNSGVPQGLSSMKHSVKEDSENLHCSTSACPIQHSENTCLQKSGNSEKIADVSSSSPISKRVEAVTQTPHGVERSCSLEELTTSLALWGKSLPAFLHEQRNRNTESSSDGLDGKGTAQIFENLPNTLIQNYDTKITVERTQTYTSSSFGKNLDGVNSNLPKSSELQVAIVTPLILSKKNEVKKNNQSLFEIIYPAIEEGSVRTIEEFTSAKSDTNKGEKRTIYSPTDSYKYCEELNVHQETSKSTEKNKTVKAEVGTNYSFDLKQEITNTSPLELKQHKLNSGDQHLCELITKHLTTSPQKCVTSEKHGPNLDESNNTEVVLNDSMLQISSVCTLVQGDAFYNSQIANIFSTSPSKSGTKHETSEEHKLSLHHNEEESGLLTNDTEVGMSISEEGIVLPPSGSLSKDFARKPEDLQTFESPQHDKTLMETNANNSGEQKNNDFLEVVPLSGKNTEQDISYDCNTDLSINEVFGNQEGLCNTDNMPSDRKADASEHVLDEGKPAHLGSTEPPVMLLNDQLTELSKEFPYGIGYLNMVKGTESKESLTILAEREEKENTRSHEKNLDPRDAVEQIKIVILNSQQMNEVFPECSQQSSNKLDNHGDDHMRMDSKGNLRKDKRCYRKSNQDLNVDSKITRSERFGKTERTYCCLPGWIASGYNVEPCSCMLAKEASLKGKAGLYSQSKDRSKSRENESDCSLKNEVQNSILDAGSHTVLLGDQSTKALNKTLGYRETEPQVKEDKLPKAEQAVTLRSLLEKSDSQESNKQVIELPRSAHSQSLQKERVETNKIHSQIHGRRSISKSEAQYHLNTNFKKIMIKKFAKMKSEKYFDKTLKSKTDIDHHRRIETKHSTNFERYKIKRDTSETRMIKGPISSMSLKRQMVKEKKRKALGIQHNDVTHSLTLSSVSFVSEKHDNSEHNSTLGSREHLIKKKIQKKDLEKRYGYKKVQYNESVRPKHIEHNVEQPVKRINLEKYAYTKDKKNSWKHRSSHFDNRIPASQNERGHPSNILKIHSPDKEGILDGSSRDKWSERSFSDKKCFKRKNKLSIFLQKEKKNYLNRVAFKRTAQKTIHLTSLDSWHSKPVWHVKPSHRTGESEPHQKSSSSSQKSDAERPQMLEFKMCPEILFRKSVSEEQSLEATKLPEKNRMSVTAVKSKREDWLNYCPVKRRKTEENEIEVDDDIPLDTAIKLLEGNEAFHGSMKDSKATFETYRKMHLQKRSQSLDSSPLS